MIGKHAFLLSLIKPLVQTLRRIEILVYIQSLYQAVMAGRTELRENFHAGTWPGPFGAKWGKNDKNDRKKNEEGSAQRCIRGSTLVSTNSL